MASFKRENESALPETQSDRRLELTRINTQISQIDQQIQIVKSPAADPTAAGTNAQQLAYRLQSEELNHEAFRERRELLTPLAEKGFVSKKTMADLDRQIAQTEIEITAIKSQIAQSQTVFSADPEASLKQLETQRKELLAAAEEIRKRISLAPSIEVVLASMRRDYENLQSEYAQTKSKLTDAQIGERLEQDRQAERFEVLEQATVPEGPTSPNRTQIVMAGGGGAIAIGLGMVFLLELLDNSIRTPKDLERRLQLRALAVIPYVRTKGETRSQRRRLILFAFLTFILIAMALTAVHTYYLPLDLLAERGWQKLQ